MRLILDIFVSLCFPLVFGLIFDVIASNKNRHLDGVNLHIQLSSSILLYGQFLIWLGIFFSPLLSIMMLFNIFFSFVSHRLYLYIRSHQSDSYKRIFISNTHRLQHSTYLLAYLALILSVTSLVVFTTQIKPSENCGPFRHLNNSYEAIESFLNYSNVSVLWISIWDFLTSPGFIYFLGVTFFIIVYKLKHEELAEKQVTIEWNSLFSNLFICCF